MQEVENIIRILKEALVAFNGNDSFALKKLSDQTIHTSAIYQDPDNIMVAVLVYVLGKLVERDKLRRIEGTQNFYVNLTKNFAEATKALEKNDLETFRSLFGKIRSSVNEMDEGFANYLREIFYKAEVSKAFRIYEHGISAERTAELLGVSLWDLASYIGQSSISESHFTEALSVKDRVNVTRSFFK